MLNLSPEQLDNLTLRQFFYKLDGFSEMQTETAKTAYNAARLTAALVLTSFSEKPINPVDLIRFEWDAPKQLPVADPELFNRRAADMLNEINKQ